MQLHYWSKHHCRWCGEIFCDNCTQLKLCIGMLSFVKKKEQKKEYTEPERICFDCFRKVLKIECNKCEMEFCMVCFKKWHEKRLCYS